MSTLLAVLADGIIYASWLFVIAAGLTLVYGVMHILNMAHGSLYALGAYAAASLAGAWLRGGYPPAGSHPGQRAARRVHGRVGPQRHPPAPHHRGTARRGGGRHHAACGGPRGPQDRLLDHHRL